MNPNSSRFTFRPNSWPIGVKLFLGFGLLLLFFIG